jgi:hypothetical protein
LNVNPVIAWSCSTAILICTLGLVGALAWHGTLTGGEVIAFLGPIVGAAVGVLGVHAAVNAGANAAKGQ